MTSVVSKRRGTVLASAAVAGIAATLLPIALGASTASAAPASDVTVPAGLSARVFASGGTLSSPDDITQLGNDVIVAYQNGVGTKGEPTPSGTADSTVVQYDQQGKELARWKVTGKVDGMSADPSHHRVVATVNEDGNSSIYTITPDRHANAVQHFQYSPNPLPHGGGTDAVAVRNGVVYVVASAPVKDAAGKVNSPALYKVDFKGSTAALTSVVKNNATATDAVTGKQAALNLTDPDSATAVPRSVPRFGGSVLVDGQGDKQLVFLSQPGQRDQKATVLNLNAQVDDTAFATAGKGTLYVVDNAKSQIIAITGDFHGQVFASARSLSTVDLKTGTVSPIASGIGTPKGLLFVPAGENNQNGNENNENDK
jgi:hypothetical protein